MSGYMVNNEEEQLLASEFEFDEEEKRLKAENLRKERKTILITFAILLTGFIAFCYFFFNYMEKKAAEYKLQKEVEANKKN